MGRGRGGRGGKGGRLMDEVSTYDDEREYDDRAKT